MSPDIFISYSRENQQEVIKLVEYLRGKGISVWMDESDIHGATLWTKEIVEAIRACSLFILAISRHSTSSKNVVKELALASEREKIILPVYFEQCEIPETMEYQLAGIQNIAFYSLEKSKAHEFVFQTVRKLGVGESALEGKALDQIGTTSKPSGGHMPLPKSKSRVIKWAAIASGVVIFCIASFLLTKFDKNEHKKPALQTLSLTDSKARIALLPIEVNAAKEEDKWVGGGMGTQLKAAINKLNGVTIISGVSVNAYRGSERDINKIRENLNVNYIIDSELAVAGENVTAIFEFIDAQNSEKLWTETYEENIESIFNVKSKVTRKIAESVGIKVEAETAKAIDQKTTKNSEAFKLYTQGRNLWFTRTEADMRQSLKLYSQSIKLDPEYAEPFTGIADSNSMLVQYSFSELKEGYEKARQAAIEAITRNPNLPQAYVSLAWVQFASDWKLKSSARNYRKAIALDPKFAQAYHWLAINFQIQGKFEEAFATYQTALKLDPNNHVILMNSALTAMRLSKYDLAEKRLKLGLSLAPNYYLSWPFLYQAYISQNDKENEIKELINEIENISNKNRDIYTVLTHYYWKKNSEKYQAYLSAARNYNKNETRGKHEIDFYQIPEGKIDEFIKLANERFDAGTFNYVFEANLFVNEIKSDPRIQKLIRKIHSGKD